MNYYKYLDLNFEPATAKLKDYIIKHNELLKNPIASWKPADIDHILKEIPELHDMVKPLNLTIKYGAFFVSNYSIGTVHVDNDVQSTCRINVPVMNCENTETRFFTTTKPPIRVIQKNGVPFLRLDPSTCVHVDQFYLTKAVVFRNNHPHQVVSNNPNTPRVSFTIGFNENIEYLLN